MVRVPVGKCLVLTRKFGTDVPPERVAEGDVLAHENPDNRDRRRARHPPRCAHARQLSHQPYAYGHEFKCRPSKFASTRSACAR